MAAVDYSTPEIVRTLQRLEAKINDLPTRAEHDLKFHEQDQRIIALESFKDWAIRLVIGAVASAGLATILVAK